MSKQYEKFLAKQELLRRRVVKSGQDEQRIRSLTDEELQNILDEPAEDEETLEPTHD